MTLKKEELVRLLEDGGYDVTSVTKNLEEATKKRVKSGSLMLKDRVKLSEADSVPPYVATITIKGGKYVFNGNRYDGVEELRKAIDAHIETLPYDYDTYNPFFTEYAFMSINAHRYLVKLGFEMSRGLDYSGSWYVLKSDDGEIIMSVGVDFPFDNNEGVGTVLFKGAKSSLVMCGFTNLDECIASMNSVIIPGILGRATCISKCMCGLSSIRNWNGIYKLENTNGINFRKVDNKDFVKETIAALEKTLEELKAMDGV